jgi:hypothetical protein
MSLYTYYKDIYFFHVVHVFVLYSGYLYSVVFYYNTSMFMLVEKWMCFIFQCVSAYKYEHNYALQILYVNKDSCHIFFT